MSETQQIEPPVESYRKRKTTVADKLKMLRGKIFRFFAGHFKKTYVQRSLALRRGECKRCGACCHLLHRCAFAQECKDGAGCRIYLKRPVNCRIFPLNPRDLSERDILMPEQTCGYHFADERTSGRKSQRPHPKMPLLRFNTSGDFGELLGQAEQAPPRESGGEPHALHRLRYPRTNRNPLRQNATPALNPSNSIPFKVKLLTGSQRRTRPDEGGGWKNGEMRLGYKIFYPS